MALLGRNGQTGYLVLGDSGMAVMITPGTDREKAVMTALIYREWDSDSIYLSVRLPHGTEAVQALDRDIVKAHALVTMMLMTNPPESIGTIEDLDSVIMRIFKYPEPYAYDAFIDRLPSKPGKRELDILSRLLERGDNFSVATAAEKYLQKAGYDDKMISRLYSTKERSRRFSAGCFKHATGCESSDIRSREDLEKALGEAPDPEAAMSDFLGGVPSSLPLGMIEDVIAPILKGTSSTRVAYEARHALLRNGYTPDEIDDMRSA
jgi:hypothetical protein